jgi:hypothetical protein
MLAAPKAIVPKSGTVFHSSLAAPPQHEGMLHKCTHWLFEILVLYAHLLFSLILHVGKLVSFMFYSNVVYFC